MPVLWKINEVRQAYMAHLINIDALKIINLLKLRRWGKPVRSFRS